MTLGVDGNLDRPSTEETKRNKTNPKNEESPTLGSVLNSPSEPHDALHCLNSTLGFQVSSCLCFWADCSELDKSDNSAADNLTTQSLTYLYGSYHRK